MSSTYQTLIYQNENKEIEIYDKNSDDQFLNKVETTIEKNNNLIKISKHPSLIRNSESIIENQYNEIISSSSEYSKLESLAEFMTQGNIKFTSTEKLIILLGTAIGIQYLHINGFHHGDICLSNIFLDDNYYPHIYVPQSCTNTLSFAEKNKNEIIDIASLCFVAYELILDQICFNDNQKIDENLLNFDLSKISNKWQKSFLKKFWPNSINYPNFNDIIDDLIKNKEEFGDVEEDIINDYINDIKQFQNSYLQQLDSEVKSKNDAEKMLIYGKALLCYHLSYEDKKKAAKLFKKASSLGNYDAMYNYGIMLANGDGININIQKALKYFEKASNNEHIGAKYEYGKLLILKLTNLNVNQGFELIKNAADTGYIEAQFFYGNIMYMIKKMTLSDALNYFKLPADFGNVVAMNNFALFLFDLDEKEYEESISNAIKYFKMAMSLGYITSFHNYGTYLIDGEKIPKNIEEGLKYIKYAANEGFLESIKKYYLHLVSDITNNKNISEDETIENLLDIIKYVRLAADNGDPDSMNRYGELLRNGILVDKNISEAGHYFQMAFFNNNDHVESMFNYGKMLLEENNDNDGNYYINKCIEKKYLPALIYKSEHMEIKLNKTKEEIVDEYKNMADDGNIEAMYDYAVILFTGDGIKENKEEAAKYYKLAAEKGHIGAMHNYASMLLNGDGIPMNKYEAVKYYKMAADNGHDISTSMIGLLLYSEDENIQNKEEAINYIKRAAEFGFLSPQKLYRELVQKGEIKEEKSKIGLQLRKEIYKGNINAMFSLAIMLLKGDGIHKSRKDAAEYFKMAAEKGHLGAMQEYGIMLRDGNGIPVNKEKAAYWLKSSADKGNCYSMHLYALMLQDGDGIKINKNEAAKYYKKAADQGLAVSMNNYGLMLHDGDGVEADKEAALNYLKKAAENNEDMGRINYAAIQESNNEKSSDNNTESINYIKKLADEGNIDAMILYGEFLYNGQKIPMNKEEAAKYFKMAADNGSIESIHKYAQMMESGDGVTLNIDEALKYYQKALLKNDKMSSKKLHELSVYYSYCI